MADEDRSYDPSRDATAQEPLTANEKKLVTRLFGDPFAFPMEFKAWLRGWLEEQFPRIGTLATPADSGAAGAFVPPAGAILDYGGDTAPGGYVMCDGAEYDKTSLVYKRLFEAIGFKYGTGSTGDMFRVPDFQGRVAVGRGAHADVDGMGDSDGLPVGTRSVKHGHSVNQTPHDHYIDVFEHEFVYEAMDALKAGTHDFAGVPDSPDGAYAKPASVNITVGPGGTPVDGPAFLVVNKIISLGS